MMTKRIKTISTKTNSLASNNGFTLIEVMIVVAIIAILGAIAVPLYSKYITRAKQTAAWAVMETVPLLVETYRAENGMMCPACNADSPVGAPYTYSYTEKTNADGTVSVDTDTITPNYPGFKAKGISQKNASLYHYQVAFTVTGCPSSCQTSAVVTAIPQDGQGGQDQRDAPPGNLVGNPFN